MSNGTIATVAALFCTIDGDKGFQHGGVAVVPLDLPGVSRGKPLDKIGQRALNQGEILFDDVRIPPSYMIIPPDFYSFTVESVLTLANAFMGARFVGNGARRAGDGDRLREGARAGRRADLQAPERQEPGIFKHVLAGRGCPGPVASGR